jgi:hypothetical protein
LYSGVTGKIYLGDEIAICAAEDLAELTEKELLALKQLYPRIGEGEGWFGRETALDCYEHCKKAL